jgi:hypothetical protein
MTTSPEILYQGFLAGLALIVSTRGIMLLLITIVLCLIGIVIRWRGPAQLALILMLLIFFLNLHVLAIYPLDNTARSLMTLTGQSVSLMTKVVGITAKALYNLGLILVPLLIYVVSIQMIGRPKTEEE